MSSPSILLVEDDPDIQGLLRVFLEGEGFSVHASSNGREALDYLKKGPRPSVVLLDLMMPVMDGYEFLKEIYSTRYPAFQNLPIIVLSAAARLDKVAEEHPVRIVKKPIELDLLLSAIAKSVNPTA